jgi:phage-related minor tail protein
LIEPHAAAISTNKSVAAVRQLLGIIADEYAAPIRQILSAERRIETAEARGQYVFKLFRVFGHGLEAVVSRAS